MCGRKREREQLRERRVTKRERERDGHIERDQDKAEEICKDERRERKER
jgi:hypothetical protein